jgi:hypothetical protein
LPTVPKTDEAEELGIGDAREDLDNHFCCIEYVDANGIRSRRRVTLQSLCGNGGKVIVNAVCHERRALRTFRADRVTAVILSTGEIVDFDRYLMDIFGIALCKSITPEQSKTPAQALRDALRPGLTVLIAAARSDGHVHLDEIDGVQAYAEREIIARHNAGEIETLPSIETLDHLCKLIAAMNPQAKSLVGYLRQISEWDRPKLERLRGGLISVVAADGILAREEVDYAAQFDSFAGGDTARRLATINFAAKMEGLTM